MPPARFRHLVPRRAFGGNVRRAALPGRFRCQWPGALQSRLGAQAPVAVRAAATLLDDVRRHGGAASSNLLTRPRARRQALPPPPPARPPPRPPRRPSQAARRPSRSGWCSGSVDVLFPLSPICTFRIRLLLRTGAWIRGRDEFNGPGSCGASFSHDGLETGPCLDVRHF